MISYFTSIYILSKENSESFIWYEYFIEQEKKLCKQRDFKPKSGIKFRGMTFQDG